MTEGCRIPRRVRLDAETLEPSRLRSAIRLRLLHKVKRYVTRILPTHLATIGEEERDMAIHDDTLLAVSGQLLLSHRIRRDFPELTMCLPIRGGMRRNHLQQTSLVLHTQQAADRLRALIDKVRQHRQQHMRPGHTTLAIRLPFISRRPVHRILMRKI